MINRAMVFKSIRYIFITLFFLLSTSLVNAQIRPLHKRNHSINKLLKEIISAPDFRTAGFAFYAIDMQSGEIIAMVNPNLALRPASTFKLLSTATALELYGPEHRFETSLEYTELADSSKTMIVENIIIRGGGDPTLGSHYFYEDNQNHFLTEWTDAIENTGIDSLSGAVIGDAGIFSLDMVPPAWSWMNMGQYYGAGPCGLSIYDNSVAIFFKTSGTVGLPAEITGVSPNIHIEFDNQVSSDSITWDNAYIYGAPYSSERSIRGTLPLNKNHFKIKGSLPDPALTTAIQLDLALKSNLLFPAEEPTTIRLLKRNNKITSLTGIPFHTSYSPSLLEIITETNVHSINLFAEHCLIHSGIKLGADSNITVAADSVRSFWRHKGMNTEGLAMYDGSGLSQYNAISPYQMVWLLNYMKQESPYFNEFYSSIAVAGESGTLKSILNGSLAEGKLRAKSGTINHVKAYAGYVTSLSGREIAFSMVANGFSGTSLQARAKLEKLMLALAEFDK